MRLSDAANTLLARAKEVAEPVVRGGYVSGVAGEVVRSSRIPAPVGSRCVIKTEDRVIGASVVGFDQDETLLIADRSLKGVRRGNPVLASRLSARVDVGPNLLGRVIDAYGEPLDGLQRPPAEESWLLDGDPINPLERRRLNDVVDVGVRAVNGMATIARGMRMGLFAGSGVGKSTLLGMMARHSHVDVVVVAMIGERGREVREFIEDHLGESLSRAVVVVSAADSPALARILGAQRAAAIAEFFRSAGLNVLLLVDSLTRLAMAGREIGLSTGEPAAMKGYPPSVFGQIAAFVERAGMGKEGEGSITGLYTVLVEGDDHVGDPVADAARSVLDGHIVLSRKSSEAGIYPPIDLSMSLSRPMNSVVTPEHATAANRFRLLWSRNVEKRELVDIGAYSPGRDPVLDDALRCAPSMEMFLRQEAGDYVSFTESVTALQRAVNPQLA